VTDDSSCPSVPRIPTALLRRLLPLEVREALMGDLEEGYRTRAERNGRTRARWWYWRMSLASLVSVRLNAGLLRSVAADFRFALRRVARHPGTTALVVLPLALALGSASTVYTLGEASLAGRVPGVEAPDELRLLVFSDADGRRQRISIPDVEPLREAVRNRLEFAPYNTTGLDVALPGRPAGPVQGTGVLAPYFEILGLEPRVGRLLTAAELDPSAPQPRIVISETLWAELFDRSPGAVGATLHLNGHPMTIVGVVADFHGLTYAGQQDVWFNAGDFARLDGNDTPSATDRLDARFFQLLARPPTGLRLGAVEDRLEAVYRRVLGDHPYARFYIDKAPRFTREGIGHVERTRDRARSLLLALATASGAILLLGLANAALLLLHRGLAGRGQIAVRRALGATRVRLLRQHVVEGGVLAAAAGVIGLAFAAVVGPTLSNGLLRSLLPVGGGSPDAGVAVVTLLFALAGAGLFAGVPAGLVRASGTPAGGRAEVGESRAGSLARAGLTGAQVALSVTLLVGSLLVLRSLHNLSAVDLGMDLRALTAYQVNPDWIDVERAEADRLARSLADRLLAGGPERRVSLAALPPVGSGGYLFQIHPSDRPDEEQRASVHWVDDAYFDLLGVPVLRGRTLEPAEVGGAGGRPVPMVVNRTLARALFGSEEALGRRLAYQLGGETVEGSIAGVVGDVRTEPTAEPGPTLYLPFGERTTATFTLLVRRGAEPPASLDREVAEAVAAAAPGLAVRADRLSEWQRQVTSRSRSMGTLLALGAAVALVLAGLGLYGTMAYTVSTRRRELGIRIALGGRAGAVARRILVQVGATAAIGVVAGLGGALLLSRVLESFLFGVERTDPGSVVAGVAVLFAVSALAAAVPLLRATRVDPVETLRLEEA